MSRTSRWIMGEAKHGIMEIKLSSWKWLHDFVHQQMLDYEHYIWRGQRNESWLLEPTFERDARSKSVSSKDKELKEHLNNFKYAVRGRRGQNPAELQTENEWWALGQHHGLATPLLDWTQSPFVALYFAFHKNVKPQTRHRAVYAISPSTIEFIQSKNKIKAEDSSEFIRPFADDNPRLVNQGGLFSRTPIGVDMEQWMRNNLEADHLGGVLLKILFPNTGRIECLKTLNRMNINHSTLFPDIYGSSEFCNSKLRILKY